MLTCFFAMLMSQKTNLYRSFTLALLSVSFKPLLTDGEAILQHCHYFQIVGKVLMELNCFFMGRVAQSVQRLPTDWTVRGSNPGGARFSAPVQTGPEAHPASCTMGTASFPGVRCCWGVTLTLHTLLAQRSKIEQSYTSTLPKGLRGL